MDQGLNYITFSTTPFSIEWGRKSLLPQEINQFSKSSFSDLWNLINGHFVLPLIYDSNISILPILLLFLNRFRYFSVLIDFMCSTPFAAPQYGLLICATSPHVLLSIKM